MLFRAAVSLPLKILAAACLLAAPVQADLIHEGDYLDFDPDQARLGQLLFYDKVLSGNRNISCATCHHHSLHGADGVSLGIGEGGIGLGLARRSSTGPDRIDTRIPRNAPALWNLGHAEVRVLFHDGRVEMTEDGLKTPAGAHLPEGLNSVLAAQALFPISSPAEMAGAIGENPVAAAFDRRIDEGWAALVARLRDIPGYEPLFVEAFDEVHSASDIRIVHVANAIAAFIGTEWRSDDSPYDAWVRDGTPLPALAEKGRTLFFGEAGCAACHNGPRFTDQEFYAAGVPQFGPGRPYGNEVPRDMGRMETTGLPSDAYRFRTPSLRNVALTGPYGHNGAYADLRDMIRHMCDPVTGRATWTPGMARLPDVPWLAEQDLALASYLAEVEEQQGYLDIAPVEMVEEDIDALEAFLHALTGETALNRPLGRPAEVPSGLPVD